MTSLGNHLGNFTRYVRLIGSTASATKPAADTNGQVPVWIDTNGLMRVYVGNAISGTSLPNGQTDMADSVPVVIASDQSAIPMVQPTVWSYTNGYAAAQADTPLVTAPGAGKVLYVCKLLVQNDATADATVLLETDTATAKTALTPAFACAKASSGKVLYTFDFGSCGIPCTTNKNLGLTTTGTTNLSILVCGYTR